MPTITKPNLYFDVVTYTGTGATQTISGLNFQPDFVWIKSRSAATDNKLTDVVRGVTKGLISNSTAAETTDTNGVTAFTSSGFTLGSDSVYNNSGATYVAWCWKANGSGSTNTAGSITSTVSANTTSGFSICTYTGNGGYNATFGHGLGVAPSMIFVKARSNTQNWAAYHVSLGSGAYLYPNLTQGIDSVGGAWGSSGPSASLVYLPTATIQGEVNASGYTYVAYCFAAVTGYSAFGSYTGNASTDGPFVYTGFRPAYVMIKRSNGNANWIVEDTTRDTYNVASKVLYPSASAAEDSTFGFIDILSNGFKIRNTDAWLNASGGNYVFACFASNPFKYSLAR